MSRKVVLVIAVILTIFMGIHFFFKRSSVQNRIGDVEYGVYNSDIQTAYTSAPTLPETLTTATFTIHNTSMITTSSTATALDLGRWTSVQEQRHARMLRGCEHLNLKNGTLTQQGTPASHILVNDKYKLMYCFIPKVASSNWRKVFMVLEGRYDTVEEITGRKVDYFDLPLLSTYSQEDINHRLKNYHSFIVVRHPLERVISAWHNKFEEGLYSKQGLVKNVIKYTRFNGRNPENVDIKNIWFSEFLKYLTQSEDQGIHDEHWETYVNLCAPCKVNYTYIAFVDDIIKEASMILNVTGAGKVVHFPRTRVSAKHKPLSAEQIISQWRSIPDSLFKAIIDRYSMDMCLFGYTEPKLLDDYIKTLK